MIEFKQLYADLLAAAENLEPPAEAFTVAQFMADTGKSDTTARRFLKARVDSGQLETDIFVCDGACVRYYWFAEEVDNES